MTATVEVGALAELVGADTEVPLVTGPWRRYVNLDYAASAPALRSVLRAVTDAAPSYASVHRGAGWLSQLSTAGYERARRTVAGFVGARDSDVLIFTRNTTDALTLLAAATPGPVLTLDLEHHANLLPWRVRGARAIPAAADLPGTRAALAAQLRTGDYALLAVTGASNVTGECLSPADLAGLADLAHRHGARLAVDGAQLVPHRRVSLAESGVDYLAFSGHKLYAPFGSGVLVGPRDWLDAAPPHQPGGGAVREVGLDTVRWAASPARHEGGTPNLLGALALAAACDTLAALPEPVQRRHEEALRDELGAGLRELGCAPLRSWPDHPDVLGIATFAVPGYSPELVATYLAAEHGIGVRDGRFCAHPLLARLGAPAGAVRASLGLGSSAADVAALLGALDGLRSRGPAWRYAERDGLLEPVPDPRPAPGDQPAPPCIT